jgi:hypothetical protein
MIPTRKLKVRLFLVQVHWNLAKKKQQQDLFLLRKLKESLFHASPLVSGGLLAIIGGTFLWI